MHPETTSPAHSSPAPAAPAPMRAAWPTWLDYVLFLLGASVSLLLAEMTGVKATRTEQTPPLMIDPLLAILPGALFLPVGPVLLWPVFHTTQRVRGRSQGLGPGEWLLGIAWLGALALGGGVVWNYSGTLPDFWGLLDFKRYLVMGYIYGVLGLGVLAALFWVLDFARRTVRAWTHRFALAMLFWPLFPLAILWLNHIKFE